jgi:hypothetical protein
MYSRHIFHVNKNNTTCYVYTYSAYTLFFLFLPLSAYPKLRTAFLEEREDDEDIITDYTIFNCLKWKEILRQNDDYYHVNLFLIKNNTLIFKNYILSKSLYHYLTRFNIYQTSASGRRGRKAKATGYGNQATQECIGLTFYYEYMYAKSSQKVGSKQHIHATLMHEPWSMCVMQLSTALSWVVTQRAEALPYARFIAIRCFY